MICKRYCSKVSNRFASASTNRIENDLLTVMQRNETSKVIRGYGAVFYSPEDRGSEYWLWDDVVERIRPGAFDRALREGQDVRGLFNHSMDWVLGRVASGTLRLRTDGIGLYYEIDENPNDPQWATVAAKIDRKDVDGSSFAFIPTSTTWERVDYEGKKVDVRWINDVDLFDVGPVTFPAYAAATSGRSIVSHEEYRSLMEERRNHYDAIELVKMRGRVAAL